MENSTMQLQGKVAVITGSAQGIGKAIVARHGAEACWLDWPPEALRDVDTPDDYRAVTTTG